MTVRAEISDNCALWEPRLIYATVVYILSTYKLIFIAALGSLKENTKNTKTLFASFVICVDMSLTTAFVR